MNAYLLGSQERPLRVAVVGSGPAGFYTVEALAKHKELVVEVDLFERLPAPYGLVRYGVAPDHQKIKNVTAAYDKLGGHPRVRFLGNVHVGHGDVSVEELVSAYDQVVFAVGCETDKRLGIPGEDLEGCHAATSFVAWYNGHPDFRDYAVSLEATRAAIIGVGDVAMDLTRMLLRSPDDLASTDVADHALEAFRKSRVREVVVLGRRGPGHAAFATKELEDIVELPDLAVLVDAAQVRAQEGSGEELDGLQERKMSYLAELGARDPRGAAKLAKMQFFASPVEILGEGGRVSAIRIEHNELSRDAQGKVSVKGTGRFETIPVGLVFRSVGYRGVPIPGLPFDDKQGVVPNRDGRVLRGGEPWPNVYVAGWIKRGPSGVIGTNKGDASDTVHQMLADVAGKTSAPGPDARSVVDALLSSRGVRVVDWATWKKIDQKERESGAAVGKVRKKLCTVAELLAAGAG
jgi:ferredoxin/flavodoxin---NADP+ reductase